MFDLSRGKGRHKKRDVSVAAYFLDGKEFVKAVADGADITDPFYLAKLPTAALIIASSTTVLVPFDGGITVSVGLESGTGSEFASNVPLDAVADAVVPGSGDISIQTGATVVGTISGLPTTGLAVVIVEYIEYEQCTGELTNFVT